MNNFIRNSKRFMYVGNFLDEYHALAILKPNIFGISRIVRIDTNYKIISTTNYFTFNNWFNGYLIVHEKVEKEHWLSFWVNSNLIMVNDTDVTSVFCSLSFHLNTLRSLNSHLIEILLRIHPEILKNLPLMECSNSYYISTNFCCPFIYTPNADAFNIVKYVHSNADKW